MASKDRAVYSQKPNRHSDHPTTTAPAREPRAVRTSTAHTALRHSLSPDDHSPLSVAQVEWKNVFHNNAYTNFTQIDYLMGKAGVTFDAILRKPELLSQKVDKSVIASDMSYQNMLTWSSSGRCTSFAVAVARRLEAQYSTGFNFKYHDLKGHRVARCANTGILIDSSSPYGAIKLEQGQWFSWEDTRPSWKWKNDISKFQANDGRTKKSSKELTAHDAMTIDSCEVKDEPGGVKPLFFFRCFEGDRAEYRGMLKWDLSKGKARLSLIRDMNHKQETEKVSFDSIIVFDDQGTAETEAECITVLKDFIWKDGGSMADHQWQWNLGEKVNTGIWEAATRVRGRPRLTLSKKTTRQVHLLLYTPYWQEEEYNANPPARGHFGLLENQERILDRNYQDAWTPLARRQQGRLRHAP